MPKKISKGLKYNIGTIFSEILGNVSVYLMFQLDSILNVEKSLEYGSKVCDLANRSQIYRVIGCLALLGLSLLAT